MSILKDQTVSEILEKVNNTTQLLVRENFESIVHQHTGIIYTLTIIYIGFIFIKMIRGYYDANDFIFLLFRTVIILTLIFNCDYFVMYIQNVITDEPLKICKSIVISDKKIEYESIKQALDIFVLHGNNIAINIFKMGSWSNPTFLIYGVITFILVILAAGIATGLIVLAKYVTLILLILSPLFLFFALFDCTKGLCESFIKQLIAYALIPIITSMALMILLPLTDIVANEIPTDDGYKLEYLVPYYLLCIIQIFFLLQIKKICSALSNGFSVPIIKNLSNNRS